MITDVEYRAFYQIDGDEGTEVLHVVNTGLFPFLTENGESLSWEPDEYPKEEVAQAVMEMLSRAVCEGYSVADYEEEDGGYQWYFMEYADDYFPIRSMTFHQGWFAVLYEGPFEDYEEALAKTEEAVPDVEVVDEDEDVAVEEEGDGDVEDEEEQEEGEEQEDEGDEKEQEEEIPVPNSRSKGEQQ